MNTSARRFRRGDISPERPGFVFLSYNGPKEVWISADKIEDAKEKGRQRVRKWIAKRAAKWTPQSERKYKRGAIHAGRPGKVFWGYWHYGMERWVTPEKFEELRQKKNKVAHGFVQSERSKQKESERAKIRNATPEKKEKNAAFQRAKRHIYSPRYRNRRRAYKKMRRRTDPIFRLKANVGTRIRLGFKREGVRKRNRCIDLLGCTYEFFRNWIASQFEDGMSFENYAFETWHIDHIIPICLFDIADETAAKHGFNYRNCRPAWGTPNLSKNGRLDVSLVAKHNLWEWLPYTSDHSELKRAA